MTTQTQKSYPELEYYCNSEKLLVKSKNNADHRFAYIHNQNDEGASLFQVINPEYKSYKVKIIAEPRKISLGYRVFTKNEH